MYLLYVQPNIISMTSLKGMNFDHDFGYSFLLLSSLLKREGRKKGEWISKNRDQNSRLSDRSISIKDQLYEEKIIFISQRSHNLYHFSRPFIPKRRHCDISPTRQELTETISNRIRGRGYGNSHIVKIGEVSYCATIKIYYLN